MNSEEKILISGSDSNNNKTNMEFTLPSGNQNYFVLTGINESTNNFTAVDQRKNILEVSSKSMDIIANNVPSDTLVHVELEAKKSVYDISNVDERIVSEKNSLITIMQSKDEAVDGTVTISEGLGTTRIRLYGVNVQSTSGPAMIINNTTNDIYTISIVDGARNYLKSENDVAIKASSAALSIESTGDLVVDSGSIGEAIIAKKIELDSNTNVIARSKGTQAISGEVIGKVLSHNVVENVPDNDKIIKIYDKNQANIKYQLDLPAGYTAYAL